MKIGRASFTAPQSVLDMIRVQAATERKSMSKYIVDKLTNGSSVKKAPVDFDKVFGVFNSGNPNYRVPSRHVMYGRQGK